MNIGEANAANVLMRIVLGEPIPDPRLVEEAGALLAKGAHKALMAGYTEDRWREAWAETVTRMARTVVYPPDLRSVREVEAEHLPRCNPLCEGGVHHLEGGDSMDPVD